MLSEKKFEIKDLYDYQKQGYVDWEEDSYRKVWTIEYCDDQGKFDRLGLTASNGGLEIDEAYHSRKYEETSLQNYTMDGVAIGYYVEALFNPRILDIKLYEELYDPNGNKLYERWFEFPSTWYHEIDKMVDRNMRERIDTLNKQVDPLVKENELMMEFIKEFHAEDAYKEWREKKCGQ